MGNGADKSEIYISFRETTADSFTMEELGFAYFNNDALRMIYDELEAGGLRISSFKDSNIKGSINVEDDKNIMFTSIPYDKGWHVKADGREIERLED